jgi:hypothetical protein
MRVKSIDTDSLGYTCALTKEEYAKIVSEINTNYKKYEGRGIFVHRSVGPDNRYYLYFFENRGFDDYIFLDKFEF